jgi:hypothetical protein
MKTFEEFKNALGQRESNNNYYVKNRFGYMGRYQFGMARLKELGYTGTSAAFLNSPDLQEEYFLKHVANHAKRLSPLLETAIAKHGSYLTLSGLIAYAHLLGGGAATSWAKGGKDRKDGNGVYGETYAKQFSGYEIPGYTEKKTPIVSTANKYIEFSEAGIALFPMLVLILVFLGVIFSKKK